MLILINKMSSKLKLDSSIQVIKSNNNDIIFKLKKKLININQKRENIIYISQNTIIIKNISKQYIALRIIATKKSYYKIEPKYVIISPNTFINIKIFYQSNPDEKITSLGHKFIFEGFIIEEKYKNTKNILSLFQQVISSNKLVKGNSIIKNVKFIQENNKINELDKEIKDCEKMKNINKTLLKELNEIRNNNKISIKDYFKVGKELIIDIKNKKLYYLPLFVIFLISVILGIYFNK